MATTTGWAPLPEGLEDVSGYPRLLAALADSGWSDADLGQLTSGNILRVLRDAEAGARALQDGAARAWPRSRTSTDADASDSSDTTDSSDTSNSSS